MWMIATKQATKEITPAAIANDRRSLQALVKHSELESLASADTLKTMMEAMKQIASPGLNLEVSDATCAAAVAALNAR